MVLEKQGVGERNEMLFLPQKRKSKENISSTLFYYMVNRYSRRRSMDFIQIKVGTSSLKS